MFSPKDMAFDPDDRATNETARESLEALIAKRLNRREALAGLLGGAALALLPRQSAFAAVAFPGEAAFEEIENVISDRTVVAAGHRAEVLIRWGDPVLGDAEPFDIAGQSASRQERQFGYNCDFLGYLPLPRGSNNSTHGLLWVNHEYTNEELMFPALPEDSAVAAKERVRRAEIEMAAHGGSLIEIRLENDRWSPVRDSAYARRITATTPMRLSGPAAGHARMKTNGDPSGKKVLGTINNCAGGLTPWGTVLTAEENFNFYFHRPDEDAADESHEAKSAKRYGIRASTVDWWLADRRFDQRAEPQEANRFGWMVEIDPFDPTSTPIKRTALGRFKHEGATVSVAEDGRLVVYMGDDQQFEFLYKFVSHGRFDPNDPKSNRDLLDSGTLFAARFHEDGRLEWLPLVFGTGPLTPANGFEDQGDVLIDARFAATLLGATPMDRPEDVEPNPHTGRVYMALTNNTARAEGQTDAANPRAKNRHGHVIEITPPLGRALPGRTAKPDHTALEDRWEILLLAGNPKDPNSGARYHPETSENGWFSSPDNVAFDPAGRLWIATDQGTNQTRHGIPDGLRIVDLEGPKRGRARFFFACPIGAELCGPTFPPDGQTLFASVQHPGEGYHKDAKTPSTFDSPSTRWPDFDDSNKMPPRPSVVAIRREGGGPIAP